MAINIINSQGTVVWIAPVPASGSEWDTCDSARSGFTTTGKTVGCPQSIGALEETRAVNEYKCMTTDESLKALGSISRGNIELGLLFDPNDTEGQKALKDAWAANEEVMVGLELSDEDTSAGETDAFGTLFWFKGGISGVSTGIVADEAVTYTVTIEISSEITECAMKPGTT